MKYSLSIAVAAIALSVFVEGEEIERVFREPRHTRGETGLTRIQPIDDASWVWHPDFASPSATNVYLRFRREFDSDGAPLVFDVSADERYILMLDGEIVSRGPNRGSVENWQYQTYRAELAPGRHMFEAVCWKIGENAPVQQLSWRGGFVFKAEGSYDGALTTGKAEWVCGDVSEGMRHCGTGDSGSFGSGCCFDITGPGFLYRIPREWKTAVTVGGPAQFERRFRHWGQRVVGWLLYPSELPDQIEERIRPGSVKWASDSSLLSALQSLVKDGTSLSVPPRTKFRAYWDFGDYYCFYPEISVSGGKGATIRTGWFEGFFAKDGSKMDRAAFDGGTNRPLYDFFRPDGSGRIVFTTPWWRPGRWCELEVETADEPVVLEGVSLVETRYPLEREGFFASDDPTLDYVQRICLRGMQMCTHETLFDCPFYEQQMYPGDTRVQMMTLRALSSDDRMIRRAVTIFDLAARDDGMIPFNYPTRFRQDGSSWTLCWTLMLGDYARWNDNVEWLKQRMPGLRRTMFALAAHEDADGLLRDLPGWNLLDWSSDPTWSWDTQGWAPDSLPGDPPGALMNLFWSLSLASAADAEEAVGDLRMRKYWLAKKARVDAALASRFWDEGRGMMTDTERRDSWSQHAQALAIVAGILTPGREARALAALADDTTLTQASIYFKHYVFAAYFKHRRGDLFLRDLDLWRGFERMSLTTPVEAPGDMPRSDCHGWGTHPIFWLQSGVAGVSPAAPGFARVRVAPSPGPLRRIKSRVPHPKGFVDVDLDFTGEVSGTVTLPDGVDGTFDFGGSTLGLAPGRNVIGGVEARQNTSR